MVEERPHPRGLLRRAAWLPIPIFLAAIAVLWIADLRVAWPLPVLYGLIHYGGGAFGVALIAIPAARSFLANGQPSVLMLGCGVLMMEIGAAGGAFGFGRNLDTGFAIYNTSVVLGALCHVAGVAITARRRIRVRLPAAWLTAAYAGGLAAMGLVIWLALTDRMPVFFIEGEGGTVLRSLAVSTAVALFVLTAGLLWQGNRRVASPFLHWYALGLVLVAAGLAGSLAIVVRDSPLQWGTRVTQMVGLVYMCVAVLTSARESGGKGMALAGLEEVWRENEFLASLRRQTPLGWGLRYGLAGGAVAAAMWLRLALEAWVGPGLPAYITFYPAVMAVALVAGFGPGVVATAVAGFVAAYSFLPPVGQFSIASPVDRLGLVVFAGMGLGMSGVAELYRRSRDKAAAYDRDVALRETQEALRRQAELIDPVRAEVIAQEMQRVVRERGGEAAAPVAPTGEMLRRVPDVAGAVVAVVGLLVLAGWTFDWEPLKSIGPGLARMKANTAVCFLLAGVALARRERRAARLACAGLVGAVAGLTLVEYVAGGDFGLDQLLFHDAPDAHTIYPGRMVGATALGFLLISASLLILEVRARAALWAQQALAVGAAMVGTMAVLGYAYEVQQLYRFAGYSSMALHTGASLLMLAVGLSLARRDGLGAVLMASGPGAQLGRRLLPAVLLLPPLLGWVVARGFGGGLRGESMNVAVLALGVIMSLAALVGWAAHVLNRTDAARQETERQLRNLAELMDQAHEPLIVRELGGAIRAWNRGAEALYGWPAAEALGQRRHSLLRTAGLPMEELDRQLASAGRWEGELLQTTRDGRLLTVESRQTASRIGNGQVLILESNRDITARKRAEAELQAQREWLRVTLTSIGDAVLATDTAGRITFLNPVAEQLTGWRQAEAAGQAADAVFRIINEQTHEPAEDLVGRVLREGKTVLLANHTALVARDGRVIPIEDSAAPIRDNAGQITGVVVVLHDVTEKRRGQEALRRSHDELERRVHDRTVELSRAVESLEHQSGQLRALASELTLAEQRERRRVAEVLHDSVQQLLVGARLQLVGLKRRPEEAVSRTAREVEELINQSLATSRSLTYELSPPMLYDGGLVPALEWLARWTQENHGLKVELTATGPVTVEAEDARVLLFQAVRELLFNIVKHAQVQTASVQVERVGEQIRVLVGDDGVGFDPVQLTAERGRAGGFGLLSIRERLTLLGGRMEIDSAPGQGTRFTLWAPLRRAGRVSGPAPAGPERPDGASSETGAGVTGGVARKIRVLLVDDHQVVRQGLTRLLAAEPDIDIVAEAADGKLAVELAGQLMPDVVLMDVRMPVMNGVEATRAIHTEFPSVQVIGLSTFEEVEHAQAMRDAGAVAYLSKSGSADALLANIRACHRHTPPPVVV